MHEVERILSNFSSFVFIDSLVVDSLLLLSIGMR
jgi:hypothetical protein